MHMTRVTIHVDFVGSCRNVKVSDEDQMRIFSSVHSSCSRSGVKCHPIEIESIACVALDLLGVQGSTCSCNLYPVEASSLIKSVFVSTCVTQL